MITLQRLTRRYGTKTVLDNVSIEIAPGKVTGFLGPNGAGKTTTIRMILGLDRPTSGRALVNGVAYRELQQPMRHVGALLDAKAAHPGRSARNHLRALASSNALPQWRVDEVLDIVGLTEVANRRIGQFSLGMGQRLGIAGALLGDPAIVIFDEPVNGLDPDGVLWVRQLMRSLAAEGRTVFVSSHLMSEMQLTADHLVVLGKGTVLADAPMQQLLADNSQTTVLVRSPDPELLLKQLRAAGLDVVAEGDGLVVTGASSDQVGEIAYHSAIRLAELRTQHASLEQAYVALTADSVEYGAAR